MLVLEMSNPNVLKYLKSFLDYTFIPFIFFCCWKFMFPFFNPIDKGMGLNRLIYFKGKNIHNIYVLENDFYDFISYLYK